MSDSDLAYETGALLDELATLFRRFLVFRAEHEYHVLAAWSLHTWLMECYEHTPRLVLLSAEKGSGKTRTLFLLGYVCQNPLPTANVSPAALFRSTSEVPSPTIIFDETDTVYGAKVSKPNEELRGLVNAGHTKGTPTTRLEKNSKGVYEVKHFDTFAAVALAGLEDLPDTIMDRAVIIRMSRRKPGEEVGNLRQRKVRQATLPLRDRLAAWSSREDLRESVNTLLEEDEPAFLCGLEDRPADVWESLLVLGHIAGGVWSSRLQAAALEMNSRARTDTQSFGVKLLADVRHAFESAGNPRFIFTRDLLSVLVGLEEASWQRANRGEPLNPQQLARLLRQYGISSQKIREGTEVASGYYREPFQDAWERYLPVSTDPEHA